MLVADHPTCDTCKWWDSDQGYTDKNRRNCLNPKMDSVPPKIDGIDSDDGFWTGAKFGCIHHEAKC